LEFFPKELKKKYSRVDEMAENKFLNPEILGWLIEIILSFESTVKSAINPCFLSFSRMETEYFDKDTSSFKSILLGSSPSTLPLMIDAFENVQSACVPMVCHD